MTGPSASPEATGQDGEVLVTDKMVDSIFDAASHWDSEERWVRLHGALAAVAPDIAQAAYERGRADGAAEEREQLKAEIIGSALVIAALVSRLGGSVVLTADEMRSTRVALRLESSGGTDDARIFRVVARISS